MGACLSSTGDSIHGSNSAIVISINDADMHSYPTPIFVSEVLLIQLEKPSSYFLCNSDHLYYDEHITDLDSEEQLDAGQIYFILPNTMLGRRLSASDMAALAVKASLALNSNAAADSHNNKNKARISPMVLMETSDDEVNGNKTNNNVGSLRVTRSRSIKKMQKRSLKKGRLGSFRLVLSTIYENDLDELHMI